MTAIDTTKPSLTIVKTFTYRGAPEEFSNTYFMSDALPSTAASWKTLADHVIAQEKAIHNAGVTIVRAIGHQAGQSVAVWTYDYEAAGEEVVGTLAAPTGAIIQAGDAAVWIRWTTDQLTSRGKPIYLRSYYHSVFAGGSSTPVDNVNPTYKTALQTYGDDWVAGFLDGDGNTQRRAGPHGVVGLVAQAGTFITTRTLERRGKRPT